MNVLCGDSRSTENNYKQLETLIAHAQLFFTGIMPDSIIQGII